MARTKQTTRKWGSDDGNIDKDVSNESGRLNRINNFLKENNLLNPFEEPEMQEPPQPPYNKITDLCIMLQEFSRRSMTWPLLKIGKFETRKNNLEFKNLWGLDNYDGIRCHIPPEVLEYLQKVEKNEMVLAGGSISDLIQGIKKN